ARPVRAGRRRRGRAGHLRHHRPPLAARHPRAAPHRAARHRPARAGGLADRQRRGGQLRGRQHRQYRRRGARSARARLAALPGPARAAGRHRGPGAHRRRLAFRGRRRARGGGGMTSSPVLGYASRATGMVSLVLFTLVMVLGIAVRRRGRLPGLPRFGTVALHRSVTLLATVFLALHIATVVGDSYVSVSLLDVVVPWVGSYHPFWLGLGTVALDLVVALTVTSLLRGRIGHRTWRALHWLAYACW